MEPITARMRQLVESLCSSRCAGRAAGSVEGREARAQIITVLADAGVTPAGEGAGWEQAIPIHGGANVIGRVAAKGAADARAILVGAHYDHLGWIRPGAEAWWGADDNAAAVAILVEVARALAAAPPEGGPGTRQVLICAFDGEEAPHFLTEGMGSEHFARHPLVPLDRIDLMIALDLCGHALGSSETPAVVRDSLLVLGGETSEGTAALIDGLAPEPGLFPRRSGINLLPPLSDYHPFREREVPFLFLTGGRWRHYHEPTDTPDRLDYPRMAATARWLERLVRAAAARPGETRFLPDGSDDSATVRTLRALVAPLVGHWRHAGITLARIDALAAQANRPLSMLQFTELRTLAAIVESALA
ncbi:MAG: M28 family peptidase [Myxococcales bacterium]|nr:M28 family peptidase [Myxococcales bacterium]